MVHMLQAIRRLEAAFDQKAERFIYKHPFLGFLGLFVGVPIFILIAVCVGTAGMLLPVSWLLGW